jgi:hypothetical protein
VKACKEGRTDTAAGFGYSARLTELILLGNLAQRAGQGKAVDWDGASMKVTNLDDLNQWLKRDNRKGWQI